jgi:endonuclease YncB( thermonuclease family)
MSARISLFAAAFTFAVSLAASAAALTSRVVGVHDGNTITVLDASKTQHKIRLAAIDAPELKRALGTRSRQNLSDMVYDKDARLERHKTDRYKREVCKMWVQPSDCPTCGKTLDAGHAQIIAGLA